MINFKKDFYSVLGNGFFIIITFGGNFRQYNKASFSLESSSLKLYKGSLLKG